MKNLHAIMGNRFKHAKPYQCPFCAFREEYGDWEGYCTFYNKILSAPNKSNGRCIHYEPDEQATAAARPAADGESTEGIL